MFVFRRTGLVVVSVACLGVPSMGFSKTEQAQTTQSAALTVSVTTPQTLQWADTIAVSGWFAAWQEAIVAAETGSLKITDVLVDIGSVVQKGDVMARLSDSSAIADVHKQEATVASAKATLAKAKADSARAKRSLVRARCRIRTPLAITSPNRQTQPISRLMKPRLNQARLRLRRQR